MTLARRQLDEVIGDLADGMLAMGRDHGPIRPTSIDLKLPVEAAFAAGADGAQLVADLPRLHTRTWFDLPLGQLTLTLVQQAPEPGA